MGVRHLRLELPPEARSVSLARRRLAELLGATAVEDWLDRVPLALSEVVTNAIVHSGAPVVVEAWVAREGLRIEVADQSEQLPTRRHYSLTSGTGRGLHILDLSADRWGTTWRSVGKIVWFELGAPPSGAQRARMPSGVPTTSAAPPRPPVTVTLLNAPLLMLWAWQEHAQSLLREYLLFALDREPGVLADHADANQALSVFHEQVAVPQLPEDPDELLVDTLEPAVSAPVLELQVDPGKAESFATLAATLRRASRAASQGLFLGPPTQPEIAELRDWICEEVLRQTGGSDEPEPWAPRTGVLEALADSATLRDRYRALLDLDGPLLATDAASIIVAVSPSVVDFLGYRSETDLLGRRVIAVVPPRYHQAHIAGTTLHASNGRDPLLDIPVRVPVLRADGTESPVELRVTRRRLDDQDHEQVFVAHFGL